MNGTAAKKKELSERGKKPSTYRRIVTGNVNGKAVVQSDEPLLAYGFKTVPGYDHTLIWLNPEIPDLGKEQRFHFEKEDPGMHKTNTVDYAVVYDGEMWLELDDGETVHLNRGDVVVQNGTRHAWRNKGNQPVTMLFFLNCARARETSQA